MKEKEPTKEPPEVRLPPKELLRWVVAGGLSGSRLYHACKRIDGYPDAGTFNLVGARAANFHYLIPQMYYESLLSYDELREWAFGNEELRQIAVPAADMPFVVIGLRMFQSAYAAPEGELLMPLGSEQPVGYHSVALTGGWDQSGERLQFINSWGATWGDHGYGWLTREYAHHHLVDAWLRRRTKHGPSVANVHRFRAAATRTDLRAAWSLRNPRWNQRVSYRRRRYSLVLYEAYSWINGLPVEVIEVRTGFGLRIAWTFLQHDCEEGLSIMKEFFVWPAFRRRGCGRLLHDAALKRAREWGSGRLHLWFHEADSVPSTWWIGKTFGDVLGFRWTWRRSTQPRLFGTGEKQIT